jgi:hypothetical protein
MVHILKSESSQTGEFEKLKADFEDKLRIGGWLANTIGGFGVNESALKDIRAFLSNRSINCHISILTTGAIPGIASSNLESSVTKLAKVDSSTIQSALSIGRSEISSTGADAYEARQKNLLLGIENVRVNQILQGMQQIDQEKNKTFEINSLMGAFTNYIDIITGKNITGFDGKVIGTPINFYVKRLTRGDIVRLLVRKYQVDKTADKNPEATTPEAGRHAADRGKKP